MSRIGKKPVAMPSGVSANVEGQTLTVKGPKGTLSMQMLDDLVKYEVAEGEIRVTPLTDAQRNRAAWGMTRTNVQNLVTGVTEGFTKVLEISGVGYRAQAQVTALSLGAIADAADFQHLGEAFGHPSNEVLDQRALHAPEGASLLGRIGGLHVDALV